MEFNVEPEPKNETDRELLKIKIEQTIRDLPMYYWQEYKTTWCGYKICYVGDVV